MRGTPLPPLNAFFSLSTAFYHPLAVNYTTTTEKRPTMGCFNSLLASYRRSYKNHPDQDTRCSTTTTCKNFSLKINYLVKK